MKNIVVTQLNSNKRIAIWPKNFILHQPRKTRLIVGQEKPAFRTTSIMSIFAPELVESIQEGYPAVRADILKISDEFAEFTHAQTRTLFLCHPEYFEILEPGAKFSAFGGEPATETSLVSIFNPQIWVPITDPFEVAIGDDI